MSPATQEQIEEACRNHNAEQAWQHLNSIGLFASRRQCRAAISAMIRSGRRRKQVGGLEEQEATITRFDAENGCKRLLWRHLKADQHFISDPARMASALREAGMVPA
jgi:hypothetical protein